MRLAISWQFAKQSLLTVIYLFQKTIALSDIYPVLTWINEMFENGTLSESHPFIQELPAFATGFGALSKDPVKFFSMFSRYPAMMYLQERMRNA